MWDINGRVESLPLTNTRDKSGWVESIYSPQLNCEDFFWRISMIKTGFYIIKDKFFDIVNDPFLKGNKQGNRPHYYCFEDLKTGIYWIIPMSSKLEKYKKIIEYKEKKGKKCDILHIAKLDNDKESVFLIQDMFPITEEFVEREYTIAGNHMKVTSEHVVKEIERKARKVLSLLRRDIRLTPLQPNVMKIYRQLKSKDYK